MYCQLSRDGAAAVLSFARAVLEEERRAAPAQFAASLQVFAFRVEIAVQVATEGLHRRGVFIAPLFRAMSGRDDLSASPTLATFKERLVRAHRRGLLTLARCKQVEGVNPLLLAASAVQRRRVTYHLVRRWSCRSVRVALADTLDALPREALVTTEDYARKVREDELRREGRPRLITLSPEAFAARVQEVANLCPEEVPIAALYESLDERGEVTGLRLEAFAARLHAAHRAGLLVLRAEACVGGAQALVQRTSAPPPIPWGRPALPARPPGPRRAEG